MAFDIGQRGNPSTWRKLA